MSVDLKNYQSRFLRFNLANLDVELSFEAFYGVYTALIATGHDYGSASFSNLIKNYVFNGNIPGSFIIYQTELAIDILNTFKAYHEDKNKDKKLDLCISLEKNISSIKHLKDFCYGLLLVLSVVTDKKSILAQDLIDVANAGSNLDEEADFDEESYLAIEEYILSSLAKLYETKLV